MQRWLKVTLPILIILVLAGGSAYYWFIADGNPPAGLQPSAFDLAAVRAAAEELPGGKASDIRVEQVADFTFPAVAAVAGDGWGGKPMAAFSFQIVLPTDMLVIDSALNAEMGGSLGAQIDEAAYARMGTALAEATQIVLTHEHADHVGGIVTHPEPHLLAKALRLNSEQLRGLPLSGVTLQAPLSVLAPLDYAGILAIAPGVVLIRAPGHTSGSQLIYVRREDRRELLFIGDIAWTSRNIETGRGRPRLVSQFLLNENRDAVFAQLAMLAALHEAEPDLMIVPGHDIGAIEAFVERGVMARKFVAADF